MILIYDIDDNYDRNDDDDNDDDDTSGQSIQAVAPTLL